MGLFSYRPITKTGVYIKTLGTGTPIFRAKQPLQQNGFENEERMRCFVFFCIDQDYLKGN
jgi:hypothetical protein